MDRRTFNAATLLALAGCGGDVEYPLGPTPSIKTRNPTVAGADGLWTPAITFSTPGDLSVSYSNREGYYYLFGVLVFVRFNLLTSAFSHTTATGNLKITGLPFQVSGGSPPLDTIQGAIAEAVAAANSFGGGGTLHWAGITKANYTDMYLNPVKGLSYMTLVASGSAQSRDVVQAANVPTGGTVLLGGFAIYPKLQTAV